MASAQSPLRAGGLVPSDGLRSQTNYVVHPALEFFLKLFKSCLPNEFRPQLQSAAEQECRFAWNFFDRLNLHCYSFFSSNRAFDGVPIVASGDLPDLRGLF